MRPHVMGHSQKKVSMVWWHMPVISAAQKANAGELVVKDQPIE